MRKIIPYIASSFKKDKIWLRRKKPSKREYQIAIVIDDSNSMASSQSKTASPGTVACEALVTLANAMTRLEVGDIAVASFGETTKFLHNFQTPFSVAAAASALEQFTFRQRSSPMTDCIKSIHEHFIDAQKRGGSRLVEYQQISFVVTDAIFDDDAREKVPHWIRKATEHGQLIVMIMIDKEGEGTRTGVASIKRVKYVKGKPTLVHYLENYPFPYFIIVQDVEAIPEVLSDALRQWFQMLNQD
jgi:midasin